MRKVEEYHKHAAECREMARTASPAHRQQLEQMWIEHCGRRRRCNQREYRRLSVSFVATFCVLVFERVFLPGTLS